MTKRKPQSQYYVPPDAEPDAEEVVGFLRDTLESLDDDDDKVRQKLDRFITALERPPLGRRQGARERPKPGSVKQAIRHLAWWILQWQREQRALRPTGKLDPGETEREIETKAAAHPILQHVDHHDVVDKVLVKLRNPSRLRPPTSTV